MLYATIPLFVICMPEQRTGLGLLVFVLYKNGVRVYVGCVGYIAFFTLYI